jgi:hypothetical protein
VEDLPFRADERGAGRHARPFRVEGVDAPVAVGGSKDEIVIRGLFF